MLQFAHIRLFYAFAIIPLLLLLFFLVKRWRKKTIAGLGDSPVVMQLMQDVSVRKFNLRFVLQLIAVCFIIMGLIDPQIGSRLQESKRKGADVMIALDVSNSMKAEDLTPNRLERAKESISKLIDRLGGDRIGIVVFAGEAFVQLPITTDYAAAKMFLGNIDTDIIPNQGTAIGSAIRLATESFGQDLGKNKTIILITDGENHEDDAVKATQEAVDKGIMVNAIGMGSPNGTPIPVFKNKVRVGYKKDRDGNTVITKLNEGMLQEIANAGNGIYVHASNSETGLNSIIDQVNKLEKKSFESKIFSDYDDKFYWFLVPGLFILLIEFFINERRSKWFKLLNLFGDSK